MKQKKCKECYGFGFWSWGSYVPMGSLDAKDGIPTLPCKACGANPNPIRIDGKIIKTREQLQKAYGKGD
jgi:hypothetical protein